MIAVARTADLIIIMLDATKGEVQKLEFGSLSFVLILAICCTSMHHSVCTCSC